MSRPVWERGRPPTEPVEIVERETPYKVTEYLPGWYDVQKNGKRISPQGWKKASAAAEWLWNYKKLLGLE